MDPLQTHLHKCKLNDKRYKKLTKIIEGMRDKSKTSEEMLWMFTDKCYGAEKDRKLAKMQARTFLLTLFGDIDLLKNKGPKYAVEKLLKSQKRQGATQYGERIVVETLSARKGKSENFIVQEHDFNSEAKIADHPMWTRKLDKYLVGPTLGVGGTATVKLAWNTKIGKKVALKILQSRYAFSAAKEIDILKELNHENIVRVYDCYDNVDWHGSITTVFAIEYANNGELIEYLMYTKKFEDDLARWFFRSLTKGMEYCHSQDVIHRDLKHDNCLLGENFVVKITDFGFATHYYKDQGMKMKTAIGTAQYAAPEILAAKSYTESVDIFSMGVMLFIALAGSQPWRKADPKSDRWFRMVHNKKWDEFFSYHKRSHAFTPEQKTILRGILEPKPENRWSLDEIQRCKWYKGKTLPQDEVESRLKQRKFEVDEKKFRDMQVRGVKSRRHFDIFSLPLAPVYFQPAPGQSFITNIRAKWAIEAIMDTIVILKGTIIEVKPEKFRVTFQFKKLVEDGYRYVEIVEDENHTVEELTEDTKEEIKKQDTKEERKKHKEKIIKKVAVRGSVQMWLVPGQNRALADLAKGKALIKEMEAEGKEIGEKEMAALEKTVPPIKNYAVFKAEGGGDTRYLFGQIYQDILLNLPAELIANDEYGHDEYGLDENKE